MENTISIKGQNYNYAPGIATYAKDGDQGLTGLNGNNIFFTNIQVTSNLQTLIDKIKNNYYPLFNNTEKINRQYQNGDIFFDGSGTLYKLTGYDKIIKSSTFTQTYADYFSVVGNIKVYDTGLDERSGRTILDSSNYNGFDIVMGSADKNLINNAMPMNIVSNIIDNNNIQFVQFTGIKDSVYSNGQMRIYFDTNTNTFHLYSEKPLLIDSDVRINNNNDSTDFDGYGKILTCDDTITSFRRLCNQIVYSVITDDNGTNFIELSVDSNKTDDEKYDILKQMVSYKDSMYVKVYDSSLNQHMIKMPDEIKTENSSINIEKIALSNYAYNFNDTFNVSLFDVNYGSQIGNQVYYVEGGKISNFSYRLHIKNSQQQPLADANAVIGIYKFLSSSPSKPIASTINVISHNIEQNASIGPVLYKNVFEFTDKDTSHYLGCSYHLNNINAFSQDIMNIMLLDNSQCAIGKKYMVYYTFEYDNINMREAFLNILYIAEYIEDKDIRPISTTNPVIDIELPSAIDITGIEKVGLLHNTEIFIHEIQTY